MDQSFSEPWWTSGFKEVTAPRLSILLNCECDAGWQPLTQALVAIQQVQARHRRKMQQIMASWQEGTEQEMAGADKNWAGHGVKTPRAAALWREESRKLLESWTDGKNQVLTLWKEANEKILALWFKEREKVLASWKEADPQTLVLWRENSDQVLASWVEENQQALVLWSEENQQLVVSWLAKARKALAPWQEEDRQARAFSREEMTQKMAAAAKERAWYGEDAWEMIM